MKYQRKNPTTISSWLLVIIQTLKSMGHDPDILLEEVGIDKNVLINPDARIRIEDMSAVWKMAAKMTNDPCIGISIAEHVRPTTFHALGFAMMASSSLHDAFCRLRRYYQILTNAIEVSFEEIDSTVMIGFNPHSDGPQPVDEAFDALLAGATSFCRSLVTDDIKLIKLEVRRKEPENPEKFFQFFKCPVIFSAKQNRVFLSREDVYKPMPSANLEIARHNDKIVADYLGRFEKDRIGYRVHMKVIELLPSGIPTLEKLAGELGMSKRNLSRHLQNENITYMEILNEARQHLAVQYLKESHMSVTDVAFRLGYTDSSNFARVFKRWFGISPKEYRGKMRN